MRLEAYHGTDRSCAEQILREGSFRVKPSEEHWLGGGAYFYLDDSLAQWWTTHPTKKFGTEIHRPAILKCTIETEGPVLDLRKLDDYRWFAGEYAFALDDLAEYACVERGSFKKMRCAFCNYLHKQYQFDLIIGNFYLPEQPYLQFERTPEFAQLQLSYIETQVCVFNQKIIVNKRLTRKE